MLKHALTTAAITAAVLLTPTPATALEFSRWECATNADVCGQVAFTYRPGTCNPPQWDARKIAVFSDDDNDFKDTALTDVTVILRNAAGRVLFRRTDVTIRKDRDGSVDRIFRSRATLWQREGYLYVSGRAHIAGIRPDRDVIISRPLGPYREDECAA